MTRNNNPDPFEAIGAALAIEADELQSLKEQAGLDPLRGCPMIVGEGRNAVEVEPGAWQGEFADRFTGLPPECPVKPLGFEGDAFYFLNPVGQVATLKASSSGKGPIDALFAGRSGFLEWAWPRWSGEGEKRSVKGYEADEARRALFDACAYIGSFDDMERVRGRGAWTDELGRLVYHAGDRVWFDGRWRQPGEHGPWVFPARTAVMTPHPHQVADGDGSPAQVVLESLRTWNWQRGELDARLLLGWICAAMVGGALDWRPMVFLTGDQATGKSTLQSLIKHLMGGLLVQSTNTTAAGIYQKVQHDSAPVSVDELEAEADTRRADDVIKLARVAASGGLLLRGGSDHNGKEFQARSAFAFSAINPPPLNMQDQSRIAILALRALPTDVMSPPLPEKPHDLGRQILRRMMDAWPRWRRVLGIFRKAMMEAGQGGRAADQFGTLAAAYHVAMYDSDPDKAQLAEWVDWLQPSELSETSDAVPNWRQCLNHMLDVQADALRNQAGKIRSVGAAVEIFQRLGSPEDLIDVCKLVGLAVSWPAGAPETWEHARLFIPTTHPQVNELFRGTQWAGRPGAPGVWGYALRQADEGLWSSGKCDKGLDKKRSGVFVALKAALEA